MEEERSSLYVRDGVRRRFFFGGGGEMEEGRMPRRVQRREREREEEARFVTHADSCTGTYTSMHSKPGEEDSRSPFIIHRPIIRPSSSSISTQSTVAAAAAAARDGGRREVN